MRFFAADFLNVELLTQSQITFILSVEIILKIIFFYDFMNWEVNYGRETL